MNKNDIIKSVEEFYCDRINELVNEGQYCDSNALFDEFVIYDEEPYEWLFLDFIGDVC